MSDRKQREAALRRRKPQKVKERMAEASEQWDDWWFICKGCGKKIKGSLKHLDLHRKECYGYTGP